MKKSLLILLALFTHSMLVVAQNEPIRVAFIGNSITAGSGLNLIESYPSQLSKMLGSGWNVKNCGVSGRTMLRKGDFPIWKEAAFKNALDFLPQVVFIKLGTNDSKPYNWKYKDEFYADYAAMIDTFRQLSSKPEIWVITPAKVYKTLYDITDAVIFNEVLPIVKQVAADKNTHLIDMYDLTSNKTEYFYDGIHPNIMGSYLMAKIMYEALTNTKILTLREDNLLRNKPVNASSFINDGKSYGPELLADGFVNTSWRAFGLPANVQFDLGETQKIDNFQILFLNEKTMGYQYTIETSTDNATWTKVVDQSKRKDILLACSHDSISPLDARYIKLTINSFSNSNLDYVKLAEFKVMKYTGTAHAPVLYGEKSLKTNYFASVSADSRNNSLLDIYVRAYNKSFFDVKGFSVTKNKILTSSISGKENVFSSFYASSFLNGTELISDSLSVAFEKAVLVSVPEIENESEILVYPNPFTEEVSIDITSLNLPKCKITILNMEGKLIQTIVPAKGELVKWNGTNMSGSKVDSGIYSCRIESENLVRSVNLVFISK